MAPSIWQLLIVLVIVILLFGTKKLRSMGGDLGGALRSFRKAMKDGEEVSEEKKAELEEKESSQVIEGESSHEKDKV